jgi:dTDP-4-dehydrorhamnose reductase
MSSPRILMTGGDGRLGRELTALLPGIIAPRWPDELEIADRASVRAVLDRHAPEVLVHAAAYTDVAGAERQQAACWRTNVEGTRNVVAEAATRGIFLVHISTDYVFAGTHGHYREEDPVGPVRTYYALSKLVAEELARFAPRHLVIRTSFRPREWPYPVAFADVYTGQDYVDVIAPEIALAITRCREVPFDTLHIVTERKSVFELARRRRPDVRAGSKRDATVDFPDDISLDISRWQALKAAWAAEAGGTA